MELRNLRTFQTVVDQGSYQRAAERLGFTCLPRFVAREELADGRLVELNAPISGVPAPALCAWRRGRWVTPAMEIFLSLLREHLPPSDSAGG